MHDEARARLTIVHLRDLREEVGRLLRSTISSNDEIQRMVSPPQLRCSSCSWCGLRTRSRWQSFENMATNLTPPERMSLIVRSKNPPNGVRPGLHFVEFDVSYVQCVCGLERGGTHFLVLLDGQVVSPNTLGIATVFSNFFTQSYAAELRFEPGKWPWIPPRQTMVTAREDCGSNHRYVYHVKGMSINLRKLILSYVYNVV